MKTTASSRSLAARARCTASSIRPRFANQTDALRWSSDTRSGPSSRLRALEQPIAEHLVIFVPFLMIVQRTDEQVVPFHPVDAPAHAPLGIVARDHGFAQRDAEMSGIADCQRNDTDRCRLVWQHIIHQILGEAAVIADRSTSQPSGSSASLSNRLANCTPATQPSVRRSTSAMAVLGEGSLQRHFQICGQLRPVETASRGHGSRSTAPSHARKQAPKRVHSVKSAPGASAAASARSNCVTTPARPCQLSDDDRRAPGPIRPEGI